MSIEFQALRLSLNRERGVNFA